jgi:hypothetical protein
MNKRKSVQVIIAIATVALLSSIANSAPPAQAWVSPRAQGIGSFIHEHEGMICTHYFAFSVSGGTRRADGWYYKPTGAFTLVCANSTAICMTVVSCQIARFKVSPVEGGLSVVFEGLAKVNEGTGWAGGWWFRATGFDYGSPGKGLDVFGLQLWDPAHWSGTIPNLVLNPPEGQHHCENTLNMGNIVIKA